VHKPAGRHLEIVALLSQQQTNHAAVGHDYVAAPRQLVKELLYPLPELWNGLSSGSCEFVERHESVLGCGIELIEAQPLDFPEVKLTQAFVDEWLPGHDPCGLDATLQIRTPEILVGNQGEVRPTR
jgi:hypothetical protein